MTDDSTTTYDLSDILLADGVTVPAGTSLLVTAPKAAGDEFVLDALADGTRREEGALVITTDDSAHEIKSAYRGRKSVPEGEGEERLRIIDCQAGHTGLSREDSVLVQDVNTPRNLTDLGIGFSNALDAFEAVGVDRVRVGLLSLSIILSYVDQETTYRFCQTLTRRLDTESYLGLFTINAGAHDDRTVNTLRRAFDGVVRGRHGDDGLEFRVEGVDGVDEAWHSLD